MTPNNFGGSVDWERRMQKVENALFGESGVQMTLRDFIRDWELREELKEKQAEIDRLQQDRRERKFNKWMKILATVLAALGIWFGWLQSERSKPKFPPADTTITLPSEVPQAAPKKE